MITVFTEHSTPRLTYILSELFGRRLGVPYAVTQNPDEFGTATGIKLNYSAQPLDAHLTIHPHGLLHEQHIRPVNAAVQENTSWKFTWGPLTSTPIPFDVFSAAFYLLSRYEEYTITERDEHGRFEAKNSLAGMHGFLQLPLIEVWCEQLKTIFIAIDANLTFTTHHFTQQVTVDVDLAYEYYGIATWKWIGKLMKHAIRFDITGWRTGIIARFNPKHDPFNTYAFINEATQQQAGYFILMNNEGGYDRGISPTGDVMKKLVNQLQHASAFVGIHPSYASNQNSKKLQQEIAQLSQLTAQPITTSRQHFLKLHLPNTYENLLAEGIKTDYTLFYAEAIGFRASTCFPFHFYNLRKEEKTDLLVMPTFMMDTTLSQYLNLPPNLWYNTISSLKQTIRYHHGVYITLWHNNSFAQAEVKKAFLNLLEP